MKATMHFSCKKSTRLIIVFKTFLFPAQTSVQISFWLVDKEKLDGYANIRSVLIGWMFGASQPSPKDQLGLLLLHHRPTIAVNTADPN